MTPFAKNYAVQYDRLYRDKDYAAECDLLETLFQRSATPVHRVLDLGCGTGGHAVPLAQRGFLFTGVDRSREMLEIARLKASMANVSDRVELLDGLIQHFDCGKTFDAVICMFAVVSYLNSNEDFFAGLRVARKHLTPGGLFVFDLWHGPAVLLDRPVERTRLIEQGELRTLRHARPQLDAITNVVRVDYHLLELSGNQIVSETRETHAMRYFFKPEVDFFCSQAGFELLAFGPAPAPFEVPSERDWTVTVVARAR